jgi:hypothetical protein
VQTWVQRVACLVPLFLAIYVNAQPPTDFTGHWRLQAASGAQRQLEIEQNGEILLVRTIVTNSQGTRRLEVRYVIGGPATSYTGLDGDQFRTSVRWDGNSLAFDTVEHEDGRDISKKTVWTLPGDRNTLQVARQSAKSARATPSLSNYSRQP